MIPNGRNKGLGFDVGFTYQLNDQWSVDGSLLEVGFIKHIKDVENYAIKGIFEFEGVNPLFSYLGTGKSANDHWIKIEDEFLDLFEVDTTNTKFTTWRPIKINSSLNYSFGRRLNEACNCLNKREGYINKVGAPPIYKE